MRLKWKLGQNNVMLELFSNKFVIHVKNMFGIASYSYNYDVDLSNVYNDIMRDYCVTGTKGE